MNMILVPLVPRILQKGELTRRQQRLDLIDGSRPVWLKTGPDILQLLARGLNLCRVLPFARLSACFQGRINPGLIGHPVLFARVGKVFLDWLQFGSLLIGKIQLLLETGWQEQFFTDKRSLVVLRGWNVGGEVVLRPQYGRGQQQGAADDQQGEFGFHVFHFFPVWFAW
jgi:hypothetical protein